MLLTKTKAQLLLGFVVLYIRMKVKLKTAAPHQTAEQSAGAADTAAGAEHTDQRAQTAAQHAASASARTDISLRDSCKVQSEVALGHIA